MKKMEKYKMPSDDENAVERQEALNSASNAKDLLYRTKDYQILLLIGDSIGVS